MHNNKTLTKTVAATLVASVLATYVVRLDRAHASASIDNTDYTAPNVVAQTNQCQPPMPAVVEVDVTGPGTNQGMAFITIAPSDPEHAPVPAPPIQVVLDLSQSASLVVDVPFDGEWEVVVDIVDMNDDHIAMGWSVIDTFEGFGAAMVRAYSIEALALSWLEQAMNDQQVNEFVVAYCAVQQPGQPNVILCGGGGAVRVGGKWIVAKVFWEVVKKVADKIGGNAWKLFRALFGIGEKLKSLSDKYKAFKAAQQGLDDAATLEERLAMRTVLNKATETLIKALIVDLPLLAARIVGIYAALRGAIALYEAKLDREEALRKKAEEDAQRARDAASEVVRQAFEQSAARQKRDADELRKLRHAMFPTIKARLAEAKKLLEEVDTAVEAATKAEAKADEANKAKLKAQREALETKRAELKAKVDKLQTIHDQLVQEGAN